MLRWFRSFLPREERFFDLFARHSVVVVKGAEALRGMLRGGDETTVYCQRVNQFENDADAITREVLADVETHFGDHYGSAAQFDWPVTREQALAALKGF